MALLEQGEGVEVPAVAIERTPWGQQPHADSIRLASCTSTAKVNCTLHMIQKYFHHAITVTQPV